MVIDSMIEEYLSPTRRHRGRFATGGAVEGSAYAGAREALTEWVNTTVDRIINDQAFVSGANMSKRRAVAMSLVPELKAWTDFEYDSNPQSRARQRAAYDALEKAEERIIEVREARIAEAKSNLAALADDLLLDRDFIQARTMDARRRLVGDFVSVRLGFPSADLRDRLLSVAMSRNRH
jgi:hypothetical protein